MGPDELLSDPGLTIISSGSRPEREKLASTVCNCHCSTARVTDSASTIELQLPHIEKLVSAVAHSLPLTIVL